jgi:hypothetical protein
VLFNDAMIAVKTSTSGNDDNNNYNNHMIKAKYAGKRWMTLQTKMWGWRRGSARSLLYPLGDVVGICVL